MLFPLRYGEPQYILGVLRRLLDLLWVYLVTAASVYEGLHGRATSGAFSSHDMFNNNIYLLLTEDSAPISNDAVTVLSRKATMNVVIGYCPPDTCEHGLCYVESGYLTTSMCYCK